jgi:hypothetical protein
MNAEQRDLALKCLAEEGIKLPEQKESQDLILEFLIDPLLRAMEKYHNATNGRADNGLKKKDIISEDDLPKVDGEYFVCRSGFMSTMEFKSNHSEISWMKEIRWWLEPIEN